MGQTRTIRACPLHVCFIPKLGRSGAPSQLSEKGRQRKRGGLTVMIAFRRGGNCLCVRCCKSA